MPLLAPLLALLLGSSAQSGEAPQDPRCPHSDMNFPRGPGTVCIGGTRRRYGFAFIYPRAAEHIPPLIAILRREAVAREAWMRARANEVCAEREAAGDECPTASLVYEQGWVLDADLPALAAASSHAFYYIGGAHEGADTDAILVDRRAGRRIRLGDLFTDRRRGLALLQRDFCRLLQVQVSRRRHGDEGTADDREIQCPAIGRQPVTLCAERGRIRTMYALLNRYTVGSWAEGGYEVEFAVTPAMIAALRPAFRNSFATPARAPTEDQGICQSR
jgi:hypothetical protein